MARVDVHLLGSKTGYTTLAASPGVSPDERAELEVLGFSDAASAADRARLSREAVMAARRLRSGRFAVSRLFEGGTDDVGRPTVEVVTLLLIDADYLRMAPGLGELVRSADPWMEARGAVGAGFNLELPGRPVALGPGAMRAFDAWMAASRSGGVAVLPEGSAGAIVDMVALLDPSDRAACRWGLGLSSISAPVDVCTLSPRASTIGARHVVKPAAPGFWLIPEGEFVEWFAAQNGRLPASRSLVSTVVHAGAADAAATRKAETARAGKGPLVAAIASVALLAALLGVYLLQGSGRDDAGAAAEPQASSASVPAPEPAPAASTARSEPSAAGGERQRIRAEAQRELQRKEEEAARIAAEQAAKPDQSAQDGAASATTAAAQPAEAPAPAPAQAGAAGQQPPASPPIPIVAEPGDPIAHVAELRAWVSAAGEACGRGADGAKEHLSRLGDVVKSVALARSVEGPFLSGDGGGNAGTLHRRPWEDASATPDPTPAEEAAWNELAAAATVAVAQLALSLDAPSAYAGVRERALGDARVAQIAESDALQDSLRRDFRVELLGSLMPEAEQIHAKWLAERARAEAKLLAERARAMRDAAREAEEFVRSTRQGTKDAGYAARAGRVRDAMRAAATGMVRLRECCDFGKSQRNPRRHEGMDLPWFADMDSVAADVRSAMSDISDALAAVNGLPIGVIALPETVGNHELRGWAVEVCTDPATAQDEAKAAAAAKRRAAEPEAKP